MASIQRYETKTGYGYAVRWRDANGKAHWKAVPGPKRNAEKVKRDVENRQALGPLYEAEAARLGPFLQDWLDRYAQRVKPVSHRRMVEALKSLRLPDLFLAELSVADVEEAVSAAAPRQAQLGLRALKQALRSPRAKGQRFDPEILNVEPPRYEEREARFLTWPQVEELASWMPEGCARIVPIAALTGLRQGELLALLESDVDIRACTVHVRAGKTKAARRSVDLPGTAVTLLREQLVARPHTEALVFPAPQGGRWSKDNFMSRAFRPALLRTALAHTKGKPGQTPFGAVERIPDDPERFRMQKALTFHDLRHTAASLMIAAGWHVKAIAEQLGHADGGALVLRRYGHLYAGARRQAAGALDDFISSRTPEARQTEETGA